MGLGRREVLVVEAVLTQVQQVGQELLGKVMLAGRHLVISLVVVAVLVQLAVTRRVQFLEVEALELLQAFLVLQ